MSLRSIDRQSVTNILMRSRRIGELYVFHVNTPTDFRFLTSRHLFFVIEEREDLIGRRRASDDLWNPWGEVHDSPRGHLCSVECQEDLVRSVSPVVDQKGADEEEEHVTSEHVRLGHCEVQRG